jgi:hypothetical protein
VGSVEKGFTAAIIFQSRSPYGEFIPADATPPMNGGALQLPPGISREGDDFWAFSPIFRPPHGGGDIIEIL